MFRILDRLIARTFLRLFFLFVLGAPLLFVLGDATDNIDAYLDRGLPLSDVLLSYAYQYPQFVFWSFPIAALLAAVFTIQPMTVHQEVMAAKAGGISFHRLIRPLFFLGILLTGAGLWLSEIVPHTSARSAEIRGDRARPQGWLTNFVYITDAGESLSARRLVVGDRHMANVVILREGNGSGVNGDGMDGIGMDGGGVVHVTADEARWNEEDGWLLYRGHVRELDADGTERLESFEELRYDRLTEEPGELIETVREEDQMTRAQLAAMSARMARSGSSTGRLDVKREQRLAIPVATLIIVLFGAPLATSAKRGGAAFGIGLSLGTTILYLVLFRISGAMGYVGLLDPLTAAWLPNIIFLMVGLWLLVRVRT